MNAPLQYTPLLDAMREGNVRVECGGCAPGVAVSSAREFRLTVEGEPSSKLTGQIMKFGKHLTVQQNPKTRRYESIVRERATLAWNGRPLIANTAIEMTTIFYRAIPKSWSKRDQQAAREGRLRPLSKPDCSNYIKAFEDGLNGVVFFDDCLIVRLVVEKWYSDQPRVELALTW